MNYNSLLTLAKTVANAPKNAVATTFSFEEQTLTYAAAQEALRAELKALSATNALYRENKNTIFSIMEETISDVLPKKVMEQYASFAETKTFAQGDKPIFTQAITQASKRRAKQFIGKVGLAGRYEVFKLDGKAYEVTTNAIGGAAQIAFEEFLDGRVDFSAIIDIVMVGMDECIYVEIEKQLIGAVANVPAANKAVHNAFDEQKMDSLLAVADSYAAGKSDIYCTYDFAATMIPATGWVSDQHRNERWANGFIANYKGHKVIIMANSFEDETNTVKVIDPSYAWIIPAGAEKPVKIAFEGTAQVKETENEDWSRQINVYQKVGVRAILSNDICVYQNTTLTR